MTRMPTPRATPSPPPDIPGLAARRIAADILDGVLRRQRPLDEQLDGAGAPSGPRGARRARPRAGAHARRDRAAPARHAAASARLFLERGLPADGAAGRDRAADRRGANPVARRARPRRRRSVGAAGAGRPPAPRAMPAWSTRCCAGSRATASSGSRDLDAAALDTPDWLMQRWIAHYGADTARAIAHRQRARSRRSISP